MTRFISDIAVTPAVKAVQARLGSRAGYARMEMKGAAGTTGVSRVIYLSAGTRSERRLVRWLALTNSVSATKVPCTVKAMENSGCISVTSNGRPFKRKAHKLLI